MERGSEAGPHAGPSRDLRLGDLAGLVAGFGLAALLARTIWPGAVAARGPAAVALALDFAWLGLAMSGPIVLGLDPRRHPPRRRAARPTRPGRRISEVPAGQACPPQPTASPEPAGAAYTRAELAWMAIGGYWIALTFFVVPARATNAPWTLAGLIPVVLVPALLAALPRPATSPGVAASPGWTHGVAVGLLWTWPLAWALLFLLGRTF